MKTSIQVAMIIQGYHPRVGGAERQLATVAPFLQAQGVKINVLTRRYPGLAPFEVINDVPVYRLPIPGPKAMASLSFTLTALPLLRRLRPHIIHAHEVFSPTTTAVAAKRLLGTPVVVTAHRSGPLGDIERLKHKLFGARRIAIFRQNVDAFITISQEIDAELAGIGVPSKRRFFIPNGVDMNCFVSLPPVEKRALRASLGLPDVPITIFAGRLAPEKRVNHLIGIWPAVRAINPDALLLVLGSGSEESSLRQAAGAGVMFVGRIEHVAPYLQAADLFVLPSVAEGLSVALLEALATGLPAIATAVGGASDLIDSGKNGWLVPPDDPAVLQETVLTLLSDVTCRAALGRRGRERIVRDYDLSLTAGRLRTLYDRLTRNLGFSRLATSMWKQSK